MTAMTDRDRAVAEKLGYRRQTNFSEWHITPDLGRIHEAELRFCSAATWETEGMVRRWLVNDSPMDIFEEVIEKLALKWGAGQDDYSSNLMMVLVMWQDGDLANALADVLETSPND